MEFDQSIFELNDAGTAISLKKIHKYCPKCHKVIEEPIISTYESSKYCQHWNRDGGIDLYEFKVMESV